MVNRLNIIRYSYFHQPPPWVLWVPWCSCVFDRILNLSLWLPLSPSQYSSRFSARPNVHTSHRCRASNGDVTAYLSTPISVATLANYIYKNVIIICFSGDPSFRAGGSEPHFLACYFYMNTFANISVCKQCKKWNYYWVHTVAYKHVLLFAFLSKAATKCRCFSLAQCFLWWWGSQQKIQSVGVGNIL